MKDELKPAYGLNRNFCKSLPAQPLRFHWQITHQQLPIGKWYRWISLWKILNMTTNTTNSAYRTACRTAYAWQRKQTGTSLDGSLQLGSANTVGICHWNFGRWWFSIGFF